MKKTLILIADYGTGDPAFTEVLIRLRQLAPDTIVYPQSTPPFSTLNTGYWIAQIALTPNLPQTYIFSNTAPRKEDKNAQKANAGEKLAYARLHNGFELMAVHAGYTLSFIKPHIQELCLVNVDHHGSQFRSRDIFPQAVAQMLSANTSFKGKSLDVSTIPDYPKDAVASIDGYGNIKTTIPSSSVLYTPGQKFRVTLNNVTHEATFTDGIFNIPEGHLAFAPGSTGHDDRFMEIFYRGKSAAALFDNASIEQKITLLAS